jgi:hypothetical protein
MHMSVDQAGDQHLIGAELHDSVGLKRGVELLDGNNAAIAHADRSRDFAGRSDHAGRAEDQVEGFIHCLSVLLGQQL